MSGFVFIYYNSYMNKEVELFYFYGSDCDHCIESEKSVDKLISEGFPIKKMEVWHNKENDEFLMRLDCGEEECGGIPFFINQKTGKTICGEASYKKIKEWAEGK